MQNRRLAKIFTMVILSLLFLARGSISAEPPKSQTTSAGRVEQVFAQTNSDAIRLGPFFPEPTTTVLGQMSIDLESSSLLIVTFSATGATPEFGGGGALIVCMIDTTPCQPSAVPFGVSFGTDSRSFTWVLPGVSRGKHMVSINTTWGAPARLNTQPPTFYSRTLIVEAAKL